MKHYSNINNSGYNWSSVPLKIKKMSIADEMIKRIHKPRVKKNNDQLEETYVHIYIT